MRKLVYGTLALSAAMAVAFGANVKDASAASAQDLQISSEGDELTLNIGGAKAILVGVPKFTQAKNGSTKVADTAVVTASSWDYYAVNGKAVVDLSKYASTKENYLLVKADYDSDEKAVLVRIPASITLSKVTDSGALSDGKGKFSVTSTSANAAATPGKSPVTYEDGNLECYTENGKKVSLTYNSGDKTYTLENYTQYQYSGGSLFVREVGTKVTDALVKKSDGSAALASGYKYLYAGVYDSTDTEHKKMISYVDAGRRPSKTAKVTVTKLANAPKATVDYVNGTVTVAKDVFYCFGHKNDENSMTLPAESFVQASEKKVFTMGKDINTEGVEKDPIYVDVKTQKNGVDSRIGRTVIAGQTKTDITSSDTIKVKVGNTTKETNALVEASFICADAGKGLYSVSVKNNDVNNAYRVTVVDNSETKVVTGATSLANLGAASAIKNDAEGRINAKEGKIVTKIAEADLDKVSLVVERLGNKTTFAVPGIKLAIPNSSIEKNYTGSKTYSHTINYTNAVGELFSSGLKVYQGTAKNSLAGTVGTEFLSSSIGAKFVVICPSENAGKTASAGEYTDAVKLTQTITITDNKTGKAIKPTEIKRGGKSSDKGDVIGYVFSMPTNEVTISVTVPSSSSDEGDEGDGE